MRLSKTVFLIIQLTVILTSLSCNKPPTESDDKIINVEPGRRDYEWMVDTLNMTMNWITSIWGASPDNIWVTGGGGEYSENLYHFDGSNWTNKTGEFISNSSGGNSLFGFSADDIWMGCDYGEIWHYNGEHWSLNFTFHQTEEYYYDILDIWGTSPSDVYACGCLIYKNMETFKTVGFVLKYDGHSWTEIVRSDFITQFLRVRKANNTVFIFSYEMAQTDTDIDSISFYRIDNNQLKQIYSNATNKINWGSFNIINNELYVLIDKDVYVYNNELIKVFTVDQPNLNRYITGRNAKDIFLSMYDGIMHYNGTDFQYLYICPKYISIRGSVIFENDVFFIAYTKNSGRNLVIHGKLNN